MYIGVDLGGTNIAAGVVNDSGEIMLEMSIPTLSERAADAIINDIKSLILKLIKEFGLSKNEIKGIGIGIPGLADADGNVIHCVNLGWNDVPLTSKLKQEFDVPVFVDNDATVAALAENYSGAMKGAESGVLLTLGTGIGGGIVFGGKVYSGFNRVGSEIGHMVIGDNFYDCNCGKNGCFETFASSTAIIKYTKKLLEETNEESLIRDKINGDIDKLNAKIIFDCAKAGDSLAEKSVRRLVKYLALGIENVISLIDPQVIAIGGGVSNAGQYLLDMVIKEVEKYKNYKELPIGKIVIAKLGNKAGIIGAAMLCK